MENKRPTQSTNIVEFMKQELDQYMQEIRERPVEIGLLNKRNINTVLKQAQMMKAPVPLFGSFWQQGELSCLFADSNLGKSILAVQIAQDIASKGHEVQYYDFELSDKQFQLRYTTPQNQLYAFSDNLSRIVINQQVLAQSSYDSIIDDMEQMIVTSDCRVVIVDNLTWLCRDSESGEGAAALMQRLMALKLKYNLSMLVIAHTPKRDMRRPISSNDLAGSRKLFNFFDSVFAIGRSARDETLRYIKQIKCRNSEFKHDASNVMLCSINQTPEGFLRFDNIGYGTEADHLRVPDSDEDNRLKQKCITMHKEGSTLRDIASKLGVSHTTVARIIKKSVL